MELQPGQVVVNAEDLISCMQLAFTFREWQLSEERERLNEALEEIGY